MTEQQQILCNEMNQAFSAYSASLDLVQFAESRLGSVHSFTCELRKYCIKYADKFNNAQDAFSESGAIDELLKDI